jgi:4-hydroxy-2-oxoglutarate aldolase
MTLAGVFAPIPTPIDARDAVDLRRLRAALDTWLASRLTGLVVLGSNGEAALLSESESDAVIGAAREVVPRDRALLVGTGRESTAATIDATRRAAALGADAVLVRTPGFFKAQMTTDVFVRHYRAVADASPVPVLLYNFTAVTGVNLAPEAVLQLASHPNIVGMKESGGDVGKIADLIAVGGDGFSVLAGSGGTFYASLCVGAEGGILAVACVVPDVCVHIFELTRQGHHAEARVLQARLAPLAKLLGSVYGVAGLKAALRIVGIDVGEPRAPLGQASKAACDALEAEIKPLVAGGAVAAATEAADVRGAAASPGRS